MNNVYTHPEQNSQINESGLAYFTRFGHTINLLINILNESPVFDLYDSNFALHNYILMHVLLKVTSQTANCMKIDDYLLFKKRLKSG